MGYDFLVPKNPRPPRLLELGSLVAAVALSVALLWLVNDLQYLRGRWLVFEEESAIQYEKALHQLDIHEEQLVAQRRNAYIDSIYHRRHQTSETLLLLIHWFSENMLLHSALGGEMTLEISGIAPGLNGFAALLETLHQDPIYRVDSIAPLLRQNGSGGNYSFTVTLTYREDMAKGETIIDSEYP